MLQSNKCGAWNKANGSKHIHKNVKGICGKKHKQSKRKLIREKFKCFFLCFYRANNTIARFATLTEKKTSVDRRKNSV